MRSTLFGIIASGVAFDADAQAFFTAASITDDTQKTAVNDLVVALKADGIWSKCLAIYPFVGGTATTHKYNLKDPQDTDGAYRIVWNGTVTHDANGITGNGSTGYGDTRLNAASVLTYNDTHLSVYSRTAGTNAESMTEIGARTDDNSLLYVATRFLDTTIGAMYRDNLNAYVRILSSPTAAGFFLASRRSATDFEGYKNGASFATQVNNSGGSLPSRNIFIAAQNNVGTAASFSNRNLAFASIGSGLTDTEAADFHTAVEAFQDALSRGVVA